MSLTISTDQSMDSGMVSLSQKSSRVIVFLSTKSLQRLRKKMGLEGTRQRAASFETIAPFIQEIRGRFPTMGARQMVTTLRQDYSLKASE